MNRRVVVTGLGAITPLGLNVEDTWRSIVAAQSGVCRIPSFDLADFPVSVCAPVLNFDPLAHLSAKDVRKMDVFIQYGLAAAVQAVSEARLTEVDPCRIGVAVGSGIGGIGTIMKNHDTLNRSGAKKISPFFIPACIVNMVAGQISLHCGFKGPNLSMVSACATGAHNIGMSARMIQQGDADVMVAGGSEYARDPLSIGGFAACRALSRRHDDPQAISRPWDRDRDGFVMGEGGGIVVLESYEHAKQRGAHIHCELQGFGMSADAHHITAPEVNGDGAKRSMLNALQDAQLEPSAIGYINAHGTSTPAGDEIEVRAVKQVFGAHADTLAMSSTKSMIGHLLGASGSVEAIFTILALRDQVAPPTINLDHPSEGCDINLVAHETQPCIMRYAMSNSFGFGGTNATLIFGTI